MSSPPPPRNGRDPAADACGDDGDGFLTGGLFGALRRRHTNSQARGAAFERLLKFALQRHPGEYGPARFEAVWLWTEWPDRLVHGYGPDFGIDLVARQTEAYGGGLCAVQAKFYDDGRIDHSAVAKFLAASGAAEFESRLLVVTARSWGTGRRVGR